MVEQFSHPDALVYTDKYTSYDPFQRERIMVCQGNKEWA
jgi:hypothetical protein